MEKDKDMSKDDKVTPETAVNETAVNEPITQTENPTEQVPKDGEHGGETDHTSEEGKQVPEGAPSSEAVKQVPETDGSSVEEEHMPETEEEVGGDEGQDHDSAAHQDFSSFSKKELLEELKSQYKKGDFLKSDSVVQELKSAYDEIFEKEKEEALQGFIKDGGAVDDFLYRKSEEDKEFFSVFGEFKDKKTATLRGLEEQKDNNLVARNQILDQLRELVDGEETTDSISTIKKIQADWKSIGAVPGNHNRNIWASYNALMDRFYDNRSIYFELKELDRKKNLESKLELCEKAEALSEVDDLKGAIKLLNDFHEEFKHIGPVPREEQENVWQRFKAASDAVYARRKDYYDSQKEVFKQNLDLKEGLIKKLEAFQDFKGERIRDWNMKTKEILDIQKQWEAIGQVPREKGKSINRAFWGLFKRFFYDKSLFFKQLDDLRATNKVKAEELIAKAEAESTSTDWQSSANILINLQQEWKKIGPIPEKVRDDLYRRFKSACDAFFENRRQANKEATKEFDDNLKLKEEICGNILAETNADEVSIEKLETHIDEYNKVGFVPRRSIKEIAAKFKGAVEAYVEKLGMEGSDLENFLFRLNLNKIQSDPDGTRVLNKKEHGIRKQISDLENNITLWKNNLEFFASSKTADKLKDQFEGKIEKAEQEVEKLKKKLSIIREF